MNYFVTITVWMMSHSLWCCELTPLLFIIQNGHCAIELAAARGHRAIVDMLLEAGAHADFPGSYVHTVEIKRQTRDHPHTYSNITTHNTTDNS